jgi:hypothetical protein
MNRTDRVLNLLKDGRKWKKPEIAEALGCTHIEAHSALAMLRNALAIEPGPRTQAFSDYTITAVGRERLRRAEEKSRVLTERQMVTLRPPEKLVQHAIRTQPNSVFNWGAYA